MIQPPVLSHVLSLIHTIVNVGVDGFQVLIESPLRGLRWKVCDLILWSVSMKVMDLFTYSVHHIFPLLETFVRKWHSYLFHEEQRAVFSEIAMWSPRENILLPWNILTRHFEKNCNLNKKDRTVMCLGLKIISKHFSWYFWEQCFFY